MSKKTALFNYLFRILYQPYFIVSITVCIFLIVGAFFAGVLPGFFRAGQATGEAAGSLASGTKNLADAVESLTEAVNIPVEDAKHFVTGEKSENNSKYAHASDTFTIKETKINDFMKAFFDEKATIEVEFSDLEPAEIVVQEGFLTSKFPHSALIDSPKFKSEMRSSFNDVKNQRRAAVDNIFDNVVERIPGFAEVHFLQRTQAETFIHAINTELLTQKTLDLFIINSAKELDLAVLDAVEASINEKIKFLSINYDSKFIELMKKKLPTAREVCESVYAGLAKNHMVDGYKSEALSYYETLTKNYPVVSTISKGAVIYLAYKFNPILAWVAAGFIASKDIQLHSNINKLSNDLIEQFNDKRARFKLIVDSIVEDIMNQSLEKIEASTIVVRKKSFKP